MPSRIYQIVVALTTALATVAVISLAAWFYDQRGMESPEESPNTNRAPSPTRSATPWPPPDAAAVSRLTTALAEIDPELGYGIPGIRAQKVCTEINGGSDEASILRYAMSVFAGDGSFTISKEQGGRIVAAVHEIICPNAPS
ncbi:hypothetical protein ACIGZJ_06070 [Kitasatospora sp. NPDC052868]|uniref:hypothetical protein n=1 Tax=Kitasatospora sp. NPDC052868 TaxID=3364060 RepID=UPI0037CBE3A7